VSPLEVALVIGLGIVVGLDAVSVPQAMISRPIVAATLGGVVSAHPLVGLSAGALLELFALETLPVGASRYPDWGPGAVAAGALVGGLEPAGAAGREATLLGAILAALLAAWVGGWLMHVVRRANVASVRRLQPRLERGELAALRSVQSLALLRDVVRSAALAGATLLGGGWLATAIAAQWAAPAATAHLALAAIAVGTAAWGAVRLFGGGIGLRRWLLGGMGAGCLVAAGAWW
jgi:PTS system mannose-specific IIC component